MAPVHGRGRTAALAACLALLVSLAFHRVRIFVENAVEQLFFRKWRAREEELKTFLREAPFFTRPEALSEAALAALRRFADGTQVSIYQRCANGDFRRLAGCVPGFNDRLNADADFLVKLRADGRPASTGSASLVLPMTTRNELNGIVVLGCRGDDSAWRPDQIDEMMNAARDVGQDLQVLEIDRLQAKIKELSQQVATSSRPMRSIFFRRE